MYLDKSLESNYFSTYINQNKNILPLCIHKLEIKQAEKQKITGKKIMIKVYYDTKLYSKKTYFKNITRFL